MSMTPDLWGPFLEISSNLTDPKPYFRIKTKGIEARSILFRFLVFLLFEFQNY